VVARLVGTDATATGRAIDALLTGVPSAGTVLAVAPVAPANGTGTSVNNRSRSSSGNNNPSTSGDNGGSTPPPNDNPGTGPSPSPSPTPGPLQQVVDGIIGVLPPPLSKASPSPSSCRLLGLLNC
jgi:hypothetical protein